MNLPVDRRITGEQLIDLSQLVAQDEAFLLRQVSQFAVIDLKGLD